MQYPSRHHTGGQLDGAVKGGESVHSPTCMDQGCPQRPQHIGFALHSAGPPGQAQRTSQLTYASVHITDVTQHDPDGLASYRCLKRAGSPA